MISRRELGLNSYAYVSLFGLNSISDVSQAIFRNTTSGGAIGQPSSLKTYAENTNEIFRMMGRKTIGALGKFEIPYTKDLAPAFAFGAMELVVRERIICLDDIERRGEDLRVKDVLGIVSNLREQKSCRVVLILNEDELRSEKEEFRLYFEKVIDVSVCYEPTPDESGLIAIQSGGRVNENVRSVCAKLSINNIRIIRRVLKFVELAFEEIGYFDWRVQEEVILKITVIVWGQFGGGPPIEFLTKRYHLAMDRKNFAQQEIYWASILDSVHWSFDPKNDSVLSEGIQRGYFGIEELRAYGRGRHTNVEALMRRDAFRKAWIPFHDSFESNEAEVADSLYVGLKNNYSEVNAISASSVIEILRELGRDDQANELVEIYVNGEEQDITEVFRTARLFGGVKDLGLREALIKKESEIRPQKSVADLLIGIAEGKGWLSEDEHVFNHFSEDDFFSLFTSAKGDQRSALINGALFFSKILNATAFQRSISRKAIEALRRISAGSPLNKRRVATFVDNLHDN